MQPVTDSECDVEQASPSTWMADRAPRRTTCTSDEDGCGRCGAVPPQDGTTCGTALLLGPQNANAADVLRRLLNNASIGFTEVGPILVVAHLRRNVEQLQILFKAELSPAIQLCIRAAVAPTIVTTLHGALSAFLTAAPLPRVLDHLQYEWVREALAQDWFFSVFHPIISARTGQVFAQEALLRAHEPESGQIIDAGSIINACEALNLQHQLDQRARQVAIRDGAQHVATSQQLFINFLPNTIYDPELCLRTTMAAAAQHGMPLTRLVFEVVETERIPDLKRLHHILEYYRERGIGTAVDDMGAGFTTLEYIAALRPDYVKLDRALVVAAEHNSVARQQLQTVVTTAHTLGSRVISEGIETEAQLAVCMDADVDYLQGFLFAHPASPPQPIQHQVRRRDTGT